MDGHADVPTYPTLGSLRRALAEGMPTPGAELAFDIPGSGGPGCLPLALVIPAPLTSAAVAGAFDHLPDSTPLEELSVEI